MCEKHNNHYIEKFKEIYPLKEEIGKFNNKVYNLNDFDYKKIKKVIEIKILLVKSLNENMTNYNYIINNIDKTKDINSIINKIPIKVKSHDFSFFYKIWYIKELNIIKITSQQKLELIAIGFDSTIILLNIINYRIH